MYLVDFFKRMVRKANIPVLIYLVLNIFVISFLMYLTLSEYMPVWAAPLVGIALYVVSLAIALSPLGEWILRMQTGCREMYEQEYIDYITPLFREVYEKARALDSTIPADVKLFINDDPEPNAFATGRKTICVTEGLMRMPAEQIKATLAHEFGHLAHKDTDLILVVSIGNFIVTAFITIIRVCIEIARLIMSIVALFFGGSEGALGAIIASLYSFMITLAINGLMWLWTKIGTLLVMKSSRSNEFEADEFSFRCGYGEDLCRLLNAIGGSGGKGLFATLASSHPDKHQRISRLQKLAAEQYANISASEQ